MTTPTDTPRTRMETAHLLCDSDDFEDVISTLKKEGEELERELDEAKAELAELWSRFDKQMEAEAEVEMLKQLLLVSDLPIEVVNKHTDK